MLKNQIVTNTFSNILQLIVAMTAGIFIPPFILNTIGTESYALWAITMAFVSTATILDLGSFNALSKLNVDALLIEDYSLLEKNIANLFIIISVGISIIAFMIVISFNQLSNFLFQNIKIPYDFIIILLQFLFIIYLNLINELFSTTLKALQRYDLNNYLIILYNIIYFISIILLLSTYKNLSGLIYAALLASFTRLFFNVILIKKHLQKFRFKKLFVFNKTSFYKTIKLSSSDQLSRIIGAFTAPAVRFLILWIAGSFSLTVYDLALRIVSQLAIIPSVLFVHFIPVISELSIKQESEKIFFLIEKSVNYLIICGFPIFYFFFIFSDQILFAWLGKEMTYLSLTLRLYLVAYFTNILTGPFYHALIGFGSTKLGIYKTIITFFLQIVITLFLLFLGTKYLGIIVSDIMALIIGSLFFIYLVASNYKFCSLLRIWNILIEVSKYIILLGFIFYLLYYFTNHISYWKNLFMWGIYFFLFLIFTIIIFIKKKVITNYEFDLGKIIIKNFLYKGKS